MAAVPDRILDVYYYYPPLASTTVRVGLRDPRARLDFQPATNFYFYWIFLFFTDRTGYGAVKVLWPYLLKQ